MNFSEQPPSKQWAALKYRGEQFAEVWFKPEGEPFALTFRIPQRSFQIPGMAQRLTAENLLKAVGIATQEVESWRHEGASHSGMNGSHSKLRHPLPPPQDITHLNLYVTLKPPPVKAVDYRLEAEGKQPPSLQSTAYGLRPAAVAPTESCEPEVPEVKWQELEARWNAILGLEASVDTLRISMEALRAEMRELIHRSTWAMGTPERKKLEGLFKSHIRPRVPFPQLDKVMEQLDYLLKDRQVLSGHGVTVYQECKSILVDIQGALRILQSNAVANANRKRGKTRSRDKSF